MRRFALNAAVILAAILVFAAVTIVSAIATPLGESAWLWCIVGAAIAVSLLGAAFLGVVDG